MKHTPFELYKRRIEKENKIHNDKLKEFLDVLKNAQNNCNHDKCDFYFDPSGNNDSYYEYLDCGKKI